MNTINNQCEATTETTVCEKSFMYSLIYFFIKSKFTLTNKRLVADVPNLTLFIPVGSNNVTYPLKNISGVALNTRFKILMFLFGCFLGLAAIGGAPTLICIFISFLLIVNAFQTEIVITNSAGHNMPYPVNALNKKEAQDFINQVNNTIANIM